MQRLRPHQTLAVTFACALLTTSTLSHAQDSSKEPPINYTVTLNGKSHTLTDGKTAKLRGTFKNPSVRIQASKVRTFPYGGITFDYPSYFSWEAELERDGYHNWTLSGNDVKILYFVLDTPFTPELFVNNMAKQFAPNPSTIADTKIRLGDTTYAAKIITLRVAEIEFTQTAVAIPSSTRNRWKLLVIQETPSKSNQDETRNTRRYLRDTFRLTAPPLPKQSPSPPHPSHTPNHRKPI